MIGRISSDTLISAEDLLSSDLKRRDYEAVFLVFVLTVFDARK